MHPYEELWNSVMRNCGRFVQQRGRQRKSDSTGSIQKNRNITSDMTTVFRELKCLFGESERTMAC